MFYGVTLRRLGLVCSLAAWAGCSSSGGNGNAGHGDAGPGGSASSGTGGHGGGNGSGGVVGSGGITGSGGGTSSSGGAPGSGGTSTGSGGTAPGSGGATSGGGRGGGTAGTTSSGGVTASGGSGTAGMTAGGGRGGSGGSGSGGQGGGGVSTSCSTGFNDDFSGTTLSSCWMTLNGPEAATPKFTLSVTGGALHMRAINGQDGVWYQQNTDSLVYKLLTANAFKVTTTVHPRKRTDLTQVPTAALDVGGLMVRDPASHGGTSENYLFIMVGHTEGNDGVVHQGIEVKVTKNGVSTWFEPDYPNNDADLRICRINSDFYLYYRAPGAGTWTLLNERNQQAAVVRPADLADLPTTVQIGPTLNFLPANDLDVAFDQIVLSPNIPAAPADCTTD